MEDEKQPATYMMANRYRGTIYIGVTARLYTRVLAHKSGALGGFAAKYGVKQLVWYEHHASMNEAILRETRLKAWRRAWKIELIEAANPDWVDLHEMIEPEGPQLGSISRSRSDGMTEGGKRSDGMTNGGKRSVG